MEKISQHIQEGTQWKGPQELDPEAEFEQVNPSLLQLDLFP